MATDTDWGHLWLWRVGLILAMAFLISLMAGVPERIRSQYPKSERAGLGIRLLTLTVVAGMLFTLSLVSHGAAAVEIKSAAVTADYLHLLVAGIWVGGLIHLALAVPLIIRRESFPALGTTFAALVSRFSTIAFLSVVTLLLTGFYGAWAQVTIVEAVATPYGWTLVGKLGLVLPLLLLGAINLMWVRPRLGKYPSANSWLRRLVTGEALLAILVLVSVGMLTSLKPDRQVASREGLGQANGLTFRETVEGANIVLDIEPGAVGPNRYVVSLKDQFGEPISNASDVNLRLTYLNADLGEKPKSAVSAGDGTYWLDEEVINIAGPWQVELVVRRPDAFDGRTAFRFEAAASSTSSSAAISPDPDTSNLLLGGAFSSLGLIFLAAGVRQGGWFNKKGASVMGAGIVAAIIGLFLISSSPLFEDVEDEVLRNPFPPNPQSLEIGQRGYVQHCQSCHGITGIGDGPASAGLDPPPADLIVHVPLHPEQGLFRFVQDGISGTTMSPLGDRVSDQEIWHIINYIKTLG